MLQGVDRFRVQATGLGILLLAGLLFFGARPVMAATSAGSGTVTQQATPDSSDCNSGHVPVTITNSTAHPVGVVVQEAQISQPPPIPTNQTPTPITDWVTMRPQPSTIAPNGGTSKVMIDEQGSGVATANYKIAVRGSSGTSTPLAGSPFSIDVCQGVQTGPGAAASNAIGATASDALSGIAVSFVQGAAWMFQLTSSALVSNSDAAAVQAMWVVSNYDTMWALAIVLMLLLLFIAVIEYVANADGAGLIRLVWSDIPMAVLLTVFTLTLISTTLIVADELTAFVSAGNATAGVVVHGHARVGDEEGQSAERHRRCVVGALRRSGRRSRVGRDVGRDAAAQRGSRLGGDLPSPWRGRAAFGRRPGDGRFGLAR